MLPDLGSRHNRIATCKGLVWHRVHDGRSALRCTGKPRSSASRTAARPRTAAARRTPSRFTRHRAARHMYKIQYDGDYPSDVDADAWQASVPCAGRPVSHRGTLEWRCRWAARAWARASVRLLTLFPLTTRLPIRYHD
jgi:hypothetical protein